MNNQDYNFIPFEQYKDSFKGLCDDSIALEMWQALVLPFESDDENAKMELKKAQEMVENASTKMSKEL